MIFKEWLIEWFENYVKPSAKDKTQIRYSEIIHQHIIPDLGEYEMDALTPLILQKYVTELTRSGNLKTGKGLAPKLCERDYYGHSERIAAGIYAWLFNGVYRG